MPGWERRDGPPARREAAVLRRPGGPRPAGRAGPGPNNPMRGLANWGHLKIHDVVAPENAEYRGRMVGEIAEAEGRGAWDVLTSIALADELNTSFGTVARPGHRRGLEGAHPGVARPPGPHRRVRRRRPPRPARSVQLRDRGPGQGGPPAGIAPDGGGDQPPDRHARAALRAPRARPRRRRVEGRRRGARPATPSAATTSGCAMDLPGGAGRLYAEADGIEHVLVNGPASCATASSPTSAAARSCGRAATPPPPRCADRVTAARQLDLLPWRWCGCAGAR